MSPTAQRCLAIVDACCREITEHGDWKIVLTEGEITILIEVMAGPHSMGYLIGRHGRMQQAMVVILNAAAQKGHRVVYRVEDW
jgi:predicted RNA-binding protein YlqC (UPF0109 family)